MTGCISRMEVHHASHLLVGLQHQNVQYIVEFVVCVFLVHIYNGNSYLQLCLPPTGRYEWSHPLEDAAGAVLREQCLPGRDQEADRLSRRGGRPCWFKFIIVVAVVILSYLRREELERDR